jgi:protein-disulfide isomerase
MSAVMTDSRFRTLALTLLVAAAGCSSTSAQQARQQAPGDIVAKVGGETIALAQVDDKALRMATDTFNGLRLVQALYEARRVALDEIIDNLLIDADARGRRMDRARLIEQEVTSKVLQPNQAEIAAWFQENQDRVRGATLDQVGPAIAKLLFQERAATQREEYVNRLRGKTTVQILLEPPREAIATAGRPSKGPAKAPIEMVEFADFQCPFCLRAHPTVQQVLATYGDRIHFVYRHYPLANHPNARPAAEAAECAANQGQFWPYYEVLFADQRKLGDEDLKTSAAKLGMDAEKFNACVDSHQSKAAVEADMKDGEAAGVTGTPAFFVNGRSISGAQPFAVFKRVIDEELQLKGR